MTSATTQRVDRKPRRSKAWIPRQHGAWAMLAVPIIIGVIRSRGDAVQVPLVFFWLFGYFAFNAFGVWVASRRKPLNLPPLLVYTALATVFGVITLIARPDLLRFVPFFFPLVAVAGWCSWTRRERSMLNDVVTIVAASMFGYVVFMAGYSPGGTITRNHYVMGAIIVACAAYFVGTALYVKTIIRERTSVGYKWASVGYHVFWTLVWAVIAALIVVPEQAIRVPGVSLRAAAALTVFFAILTVRAWLLAGRKLRPRDIGIGEIVASTALLVIAVRIW